MTRFVRTQTSFAAGELDPLLAGRLDLRAQQEGAARLRNLFPMATGGLRRRPGLRFVAEVAGARRLIGFSSSAGDLLLALAPDRIELFAQEVAVASLPAAVWTAEQLGELSWTVFGEELLLCHPDVEPRRLRRDVSGAWVLETWEFDRQDPDNPLSAPRLPYARFAPADVRLELLNLRTDPGDPSLRLVDLRASAPVFTTAHLAAWLAVEGRYIQITNITSDFEAEGASYDDLSGISVTRDWREQAFGPVRGWPAVVAVHQNRLVIGGSRDLPDHVWLSRSGRPFDFDPGSGLDDEAIAFRLASGERHVIRGLHSGRRLQLFTTAGEWVVEGRPLTPTNIEVVQHTTVGSPPAPRIRPVEVDGATLFVGASGREVREFVYVDSAQAWQAADIALLAGHLVSDPRDLAFDGRRRQLLLLRGDGSLASCTIDRNSNVVAWALQTTEGAFRAIEVFAGESWVLVERDGTTSLERFDDGFAVDRAELRTNATPTTTWTGLDAFVGKRVAVWADGELVGIDELQSGTLLLAEPASELVIGLPYTHEIVPLSALAGSSGIAPDARYRPVRLSFRVADVSALTCDLGQGPAQVALPQVPYSGDVSLRLLGWRRGGEPVWRIVQEHPSPFVLLAATLEMKVNR